MMVTALAAALPWEARVFAALTVGFAASAVFYTAGMTVCGGGILALACFVAVDKLDL